jgi:hypothetical protein
MEDGKMSLDEMRDIVRQADYVEFHYRQNEQQAWEREQRAKAPEVLAMLRRHVPPDLFPELERFLSTRFGSDCLRDALRRDLTREALRKHMPAEHWQDIEEYLDTDCGSGRVSAAFQAAQSAGDYIPPRG